MKQEVATTGDRRSIRIRVHAKAKNAILAEFAEKCGSVLAAAAAVGVSPECYSSWLNFRSRPIASRGLERTKKIIIALERETGHNIRDIFPLEKNEMRQLEKPRTYERKVPLETLSLYAAESRKELVYHDGDALEQEEMRDDISAALSRLPFRMRTLIVEHYGLDGSKPKSGTDLAEKYHLSKARVCQIIRDGIKRLQLPSNSSILAQHLDD